MAEIGAQLLVDQRKCGSTLSVFQVSSCLIVCWTRNIVSVIEDIGLECRGKSGAHHIPGFCEAMGVAVLFFWNCPFYTSPFPRLWSFVKMGSVTFNNGRMNASPNLKLKRQPVSTLCSRDCYDNTLGLGS